MKILVRKLRRESPKFDGSKFREEVFSKSIRAGKRTYFFDVKSTRNDELYMTITESKMVSGREEEPVFEKHKIFLYREDFENFARGLSDVLNYIDRKQPLFNQQRKPITKPLNDDEDLMPEFSDVEFDDLTN